MKKFVVKFLQRHGFAMITPSVFACMTKDSVIHHVSVYSNRLDGTSVWVAVTHPVFLGTDGDLREASSPVCGKMSPTGVTSNWTWRDESPTEVDSALMVLLEFFGNFRSIHDIQQVLIDRFVQTEFALLASEIAGKEAKMDIPIATYPITGNAPSAKEARNASMNFIARMLSDDGFVAVPGNDVVVVRPRGELFECVRVVLDEFSVIASLTCFLWSKDVWRADRRWKGTYYPLVPMNVIVDGVSWAMQVRHLSGANSGMLRTAVLNLFLESAEIVSVEDFIDSIGSEWVSLKSALIGVRAKNA